MVDIKRPPRPPFFAFIEFEDPRYAFYPVEAAACNDFTASNGHALKLALVRLKGWNLPMREVLHLRELRHARLQGCR